METNFIFKANQLAKVLPDISIIADTEDWHHIVITYDDDKPAFLVVSYVWDTRSITRTAMVYNGNDIYDSLVELMNDKDKCSTLAAIDNHQQLNIQTADDDYWFDYIRYINANVTNEKRQLHLTTSTKKSPYHTTKTYLINGMEVASTSKITTSEGTQKFYSWNRHTIAKLFGMHRDTPEASIAFINETFKDCMYNLEHGNFGRTLCKTEVINTLATAFNANID